MILRILLFTLVAIAVLTAGGAIYTRNAAMNPELWHVEPAAAVRSGRPNDFLVAEDGDVPPVLLPGAPEEVAARLDAVAMAEPRTERIAGAPSEAFMTYVQRSRLMGFPDAVSVRVEPAEEGSRLTIWSRSRFGQSDLGVNRARVERWLEALRT
jgi:uncharacterized protein (DUF1499 family)